MLLLCVTSDIFISNLPFKKIFSVIAQHGVRRLEDLALGMGAVRGKGILACGNITNMNSCLLYSLERMGEGKAFPLPFWSLVVNSR